MKLAALKKIVAASFLLVFPLALPSCTLPKMPKSFCLPLPIPLIGCKKSTGPVILKYWGLWEREENIQPLIDEYQRQNPDVTVEYEMRDPKDYFESVRARINSDEAPDIIRVHLTWVPFLYKNLSYIPADIMDNATYESTFYPITKKTLFFNDKYYGIPLEIDGLSLVYNKDFFSEVGLTGPPQSWDEFRSYVHKLTKKDTQGNIIRAGAALGYAKNVDHFSDILGLMFAQNGVVFETNDGKVNFHQSFSADGRNLAAEALSFYSLFATSEKSWNSTWESSTLAFANEKVAMILVPSFRILDIKNLNPDINIGVAKAPQLPSSTVSEKGTNWASFWVEVVPKSSANPREAWNFLKFLVEKEKLTEFYKICSQSRLFGEPYSRSDLASSLSADKYTYPYVTQADTYTSWYFAGATYDNILNDKIISALEMAVENVARGSSPEEELKQTAPKIQQVLDSLRK